MSQTDKLLRNLSNSGLLNPAEEHVVVGKDRKITVPDNMKRIAVQNDHNIETLTFDCPRFWDGQDMSEMTVYINYLCADRAKGSYRAENVVSDKYLVDTMHFNWTISRNVTTAAGKIAFQVCIKKADAEGIEVAHWNSEVCKDCFISESLDCGNEDIVELLPDVIEQWRRELIEKCDSGEFDGPPGVSPVITTARINGGYRVTIVDIEGTKYFDVMDTYIDSSEAVKVLLNNYVYIGSVEPANGPAMWFNTSGEDSDSGILKVKDADGTVHVFYPSTKLENVDGFDAVQTEIDTLKGYFANGVAKIQNGGTGASDAATARENLGAAAKSHTHPASDLISGEVPVVRGGTGASTAAAARTNLGITPANIGAKATGDVESIARGGTGASDAATARENLGVPAKSHTHSASDLNSGTVPITRGGTGASTAAKARENLGITYGTSLPSAGTAGRIFFKKVVE